MDIVKDYIINILNNIIKHKNHIVLRNRYMDQYYNIKEYLELNYNGYYKDLMGDIDIKPLLYKINH